MGGKNLIGMDELVGTFHDAGYLHVRTHGQSGNVLFDTEHAGGAALESSLR
jgi:uncharacterized protein (DUF1697 family)